MYGNYNNSDLGGTQINNGNGYNNNNNNNNNASMLGGYDQTPSKYGQQSGSNKEADKVGILPVTIKQVLHAKKLRPDQPLTIDGIQVSNVHICGYILNIDRKNSFTNFKISDNTGIINAKLFLNNDNDDEKLENTYKEYSYVHIYGKITEYQSIRSMTIYHMENVADMNSITFHYLECIYAHELNTRPKKILSYGKNTAQIQHSSLNNNNNNNNNIMRNNNSMNNNDAFGNPNDNANDTDELTPIQRSVIHYISSHGNGDAGCKTNDLFSALHNLSIQEIKIAINELVEGGLLYSTIDEDHYKATTN